VDGTSLILFLKQDRSEIEKCFEVTGKARPCVTPLGNSVARGTGGTAGLTSVGNTYPMGYGLQLSITAKAPTQARYVITGKLYDDKWGGPSGTLEAFRSYVAAGTPSSDDIRQCFGPAPCQANTFSYGGADSEGANGD
jgi:hypothetical protein